MFPFLFDPTFILLIPALILAFYAQSKVKKAFAKYSKVRSKSGITGAQVARALLERNGLGNVSVTKVQGRLSDHYDPRKRILRLSESTYNSNSVAALGVAAHETGHALQHGMGYFPLSLRNAIAPVVGFGSNLALPLFLIGFLFASMPLVDVGIILFTAAVVFHLITLPVEINASRRALALLGRGGYLQRDEIGSAKSVLSAAAWTYIAAATMAVMWLIRLLVLRSAMEE